MLTVKSLTVSFDVASHRIHAVDGVSFDVPEKTTVGIVGESGSGKSVTAMAIMGLLDANGRIESGDILWHGQSMLAMSEHDRHAMRGRDIGLIFQNPLASLNPVFTIGNQLIETIMRHQNVTKDDARHIAADVLTQVNIPDAATRLNDYPHQFSLGMCQRIMIALTLAMKPKLLIADEATASLDVTIQAQLLALLNELKDRHGLSILMISHDLGVMAQHCDNIVVMYLGRVIEHGTPIQIFKSPKHPYTRALISAIPVPDPDIKTIPMMLSGELPSPMNPPKGCAFHPRCPIADDRCRMERPTLDAIQDRLVACFKPGELDL